MACARVEHVELVEDRGDLVAHGLLRHAQVGCDLQVVQPMRQQFQQLALARRQLRKHAGAATLRLLLGEKGTDLAEAARERRLVFQQHVVAAFQGHEACAGNQAGDVSALLERDPRVSFRMQHQGRAGDLRCRFAGIDLAEGGEHARSVFRGVWTGARVH
jgi:hypothetical protein